jgi:hypothetical protein
MTVGAEIGRNPLWVKIGPDELEAGLQEYP